MADPPLPLRPLPYAAEKDANDAAIFAAETAGRGTIDAYPRKLTIELTVDCNLRCPPCEFTPGRLWAKKNLRDWIPDTAFEDLRNFAARVFPFIRLVVPSVV
ncbi:MAG: hypothetical protein ACREIU_00940 [Planctomycetota bacterium]